LREPIAALIVADSCVVCSHVESPPRATAVVVERDQRCHDGDEATAEPEAKGALRTAVEDRVAKAESDALPIVRPLEPRLEPVDARVELHAGAAALLEADLDGLLVERLSELDHQGRGGGDVHGDEQRQWH